MKWIIYWLTLMVILPLLYWFWRKKSYRLFLGIVILIVLIVGWILPSKLVFSVLERELKKVNGETRIKGKSWQKLEAALRNTEGQESTSKNQTKLTLEKEILRRREKAKKINQEKNKIETEEREYYRNQHLPEWQGKGEEIRKKHLEILGESVENGYLLGQKEWEWVVKWGGKTTPQPLLFCGKEFNYELLKKRYVSFGGSWQLIRNWRSNWNNYEYSNVIDFTKHGNSNPQFLREKILNIYTQSQNQIDMDCNQDKHSRGELNILFQNIDKITNPNLAKELSIVLDPTQNTDLGKYSKKISESEVERPIDLSKFLLIATTSTTNPQLPKEIRTKLKLIQPFLDKYSWLIFVSSTGAEVIIFLLIIKKKAGWISK